MDWEDAFPMGHKRVRLGSWEIDRACPFAKRTSFDNAILSGHVRHWLFRQDQILRQNLISRTDSPAKSGIRTRLSGKIKYQDKILRKKIVWQNTYPAKSRISRDLSGKI